MTTFIPALVTALAGFLGVLAGVLVTGSREEKKWYREQKLKGVVDFIAGGSGIFEHNTGGRVRGPEKLAEIMDSMQQGRAMIYLLCGQETVDSAEMLAKLTMKASDSNVDDQYRETLYKTLRELTARSRAELVRRAPKNLRPATPSDAIAAYTR